MSLPASSYCAQSHSLITNEWNWLTMAPLPPMPPTNTSSLVLNGHHLSCVLHYGTIGESAIIHMAKLRQFLMFCLIYPAFAFYTIDFYVWNSLNPFLSLPTYSYVVCRRGDFIWSWGAGFKYLRGVLGVSIGLIVGFPPPYIWILRNVIYIMSDQEAKGIHVIL